MTTEGLQTPAKAGRVPTKLLLRHSTPVQPWQLATPKPRLRLTDMSPYRPSRREFLIGAAGLLVLAPFGCGSGEESGGGGETTSSGSRTIEHKYGSTEISGTPRRIVTVGFTDQDPVLALEETPAGIREWYGDYPNATWPWAQDELGEAEPEVIPSTELDFEQIAAIEPDLLLGLNSGLTQQQYDTLSDIAPTIAQPGDYPDFGVPWQQQQRAIGRALGREKRAEKLVSDLESRFDRVREQHPEFEGARGIVVGVIKKGDSYAPAPYAPQDVRGRFMGALGFEQPDEIRELAGDAFFTEISRERLDLLDTADVVIWVETDQGFDPVKNDPLYGRLDIAQQGRDVFLEDKVLNGAFSFGTVLSLPLVLDELVPRLSAALSGNPDTGGTTAS